MNRGNEIALKTSLIATGIFESEKPNEWQNNSAMLALTNTTFKYSCWSGCWYKHVWTGPVRCDIEYVLENVSEDIQTVLLFNLELFR